MLRRAGLWLNRDYPVSAASARNRNTREVVRGVHVEQHVGQRGYLTLIFNVIKKAPHRGAFSFRCNRNSEELSRQSNNVIEGAAFIAARHGAN